jgi:hypothetical protein
MKQITKGAEREKNNSSNTMKTANKRITSLLVVLALVCSLVPAAIVYASGINPGDIVKSAALNSPRTVSINHYLETKSGSGEYDLAGTDYIRAEIGETLSESEYVRDEYLNMFSASGSGSLTVSAGNRTMNIYYSH